MLRCKYARLLLELTQRDVSRLTKGVVARTVLCHIERGRTNPTTEERAALSAVLNCPADRLTDHVSTKDLPDGAESRDSEREAREK